MEAACVYFMRQVGTAGPVKIGHSTAPWSRLANYIPWSPLPLEIVATIKGPADLERRFHAAFADHFMHHEWFAACAEIDAAIDAIQAGTFDPAQLPPPRVLRPKKVMPAEAVEAGRVSRALERLRKAGVEFPPEVSAARSTYRCSPDEVKRRRAVVADFVASHRTTQEAA